MSDRDEMQRVGTKGAGLRPVADAIHLLEPAVERTSFTQPLARAIAEAKVVSFDLFDTLVRRPFLEPVHLFDLMEAKSKLAGFGAQRPAAERAARERHRKQIDVTLAQIHELLPEYEARDQEIEQELALIYPRSRVAEAFRHLKATGKTLAIVTDVYLDRKTIEGVIERTGVRPDHLVISCEENTMKADGSSFRRLMELSGTRATDILHIGDNLVSDFQAPARLGIASVHLDRNLPSRIAGSKLVRQLLDKLASNGSIASSVTGAAIRDWVEDNVAIHDPELAHSRRFWRVVGATHAAPLAYDFAKWVHAVKRDRGLTRIGFAARDGYLPLEAYRRIDTSDTGVYISISRAAVVLASLDRGHEAVFTQLVAGAPAPVSAYIGRLGLDDDRVLSEALDYFGGDVDITDAKRKRLRQFFEAQSPLLRRHAEEAREGLRRHLEKSGMLRDPERTALVDIGWGGTTAALLGQLFPATARWTYLYLGTHRLLELDAPHQSYVFDRGLPRDIHDTFFECPEIPELLLSAPHSSILGLAADGNEGYRVRYAPSDSWPERRGIIEAMSEGAFEAIAHIHELMLRLEQGCDPRTSANVVANLTRIEDLEAGKHIAQVRHSLGIGDSVVAPLVPEGPQPYAATLRRLVRARRADWHAAGIYWPHYARRSFAVENRGVKWSVGWLANRLGNMRTRLR